MTTYTCKCGKTFQKNTSAATTGNRMPDYGPEHECLGCPFVKMVSVRDPFENKDSDVAECRGCKEKLFYDTVATCVESKASTLHVKSLDFDFIQAMTDFYNTLDGIDHMQHLPQAGMDEAHGRLPFSFSFPQNLKGEAAKQKLIEQFFEPVNTGNSYSKIYARKDVSGCWEWQAVTRKIREAKEEAQSMNAPAETKPFTAVKYHKENRIYHIGPYQDKFRTFFCFLEAPSDETFLGALPACDAPEIAQKMLDDYAEKNEFEVYTEATTEQDKPLSAEENIDSGNTGLEQNKPGEAPEESDVNDDAENGDDSPKFADETCDWDNASGGDEEKSEDRSAPSVPKDIVVGERVSLRGREFDEILDAADSALNGLICTLRDKKQHDGELNIKVLFEDYGTAFRFSGQVSGKINYSLKPVKINLDENVEIKFNEFGIPIIPYNREHQMNFDEIQPGRVIAPVTTTVDGNTGLVENVDAGEDIPPDDSAPFYPCNNIDCPFFAFPDSGEAGCGFDPENDDDKNARGDLLDAVIQYSCQRNEILDAYNADTDFESGEETLNDMPVEESSENSADESTECSQFDCMFYSSDAQGHCVFDSKQSYYNAPNDYPADQDDVIESVEDYSCQKPELMAEYNKIKENENHDEN